VYSTFQKKGWFHLDGKYMVGLHINMEAQIHILEQEAYSAVLRAFQAQADEFSWVSPLSSFCHQKTKDLAYMVSFYRIKQP